MEASPLGVVVCDETGTIRVWNKQAEEILGVKSDNAVSSQLGEMGSKLFQGSSTSINKEDGKRDSAFRQNLELENNFGEQKYLQLAYSNVLDQDGNVFANQVVFNDVTSERTIRKKVDYLEHFDATTGLYNFNTFYREGIEQIEHFSQKDHALILINLDRLHMINHNYGTEFGDRLIRIVGMKLEELVGKSAIVARLRGDEFGVMLPWIEGQHEVNDVVREIMNELSKTNTILDVSIHITASAGASLYPNDGDSFEELYQKASLALKTAKKERNSFCFFDESLRESLDSYYYENELQKAIMNEEICLVYQPQYNLHTGEIVGVEALARWHHEEYGAISPGTFIPIAEETGLIIPLTDYVIKKVCEDYNKLKNSGVVLPRMSVNISAKQFSKFDFVDELLQTLDDYELPYNAFEIEITERVTMDIEQNLKKLIRLRTAGVYVSIDDFGTGYSSLKYIRELPVDFVKIDQTFITAATNDDGKKMVEFIVDLAELCEVEVIAEGVETKEQEEFLKTINCPYVQGFYFARPMSYERLITIAS